MKHQHPNGAVDVVTLQSVVDRLSQNTELSGSRKRDLKSAVTSYAKLKELPLSSIVLDVADIRRTLDAAVPAQLKISAKRFSNLRSDLAAALATSGLCAMLSTAAVKLDVDWRVLFGTISDPGVERGLSRFCRWASLRHIRPYEVSDAVLVRFANEIATSTLVRGLDGLHRSTAVAWNRLCSIRGDGILRAVAVPMGRVVPTRLPWLQLPVSFRQDVDAYLDWSAVPDPLDENARARRLAPATLHLRREQIHSAVTAAVAAGTDVSTLTRLAELTKAASFRALLRQMWNDNGKKLTAYTHGVAGALIAIAKEWVRAPATSIDELKMLRRKLGSLPTGLTGKNRVFLRQFEDPRLVQELVDLPDQMWRKARSELKCSRRSFVDLQNALAVDLLLHIPLRMENIAALSFSKHLHWPRGEGKPALVVFGEAETKTEERLEFEIPKHLADRLVVYRQEIVPKVTGKHPDAVFVKWNGAPRGQEAIATGIERTIRRNIGAKLTPHQFRHLCAKLILDAEPGAYELVRQMLGHRNMKTTTNFYAGIDTRRAGKAHANLVMKLKEEGVGRRRRPRPRKKD